MRHGRCPAENRKSLSRRQAAILAFTGARSREPTQPLSKSPGHTHRDAEVFVDVADRPASHRAPGLPATCRQDRI